MSTIGIILIAFLVFLALREVYCWYFKLNDILREQRETNRLLRKLTGEREPEATKSNPEPISKGDDPEDFNKRLYG